jgi:hypothetical protein
MIVETDEIKLCKNIQEYTHDPLGYVLYAFPWGKPGTVLENETGPDEWQRKLLESIGRNCDNLKDALDRVHKYSRGSGNGIGKSTMVAWIVLWGMSTFPDTRGILTANTDNQIKTKTWPEVGKWYHLCINKHWFSFTKTRLASVLPGHEDSWRFDAIPWSKENPAAFAGLHNKSKRAIIIFDESSEIADEIWDTQEGALTDEATEIMWFVFGNRTVNTGKFSRTFKEDAAEWDHECIDSRTVKISNKALLKRWIDKYGLDSDFVRVHVLGDEPLSNPDQYIPQKWINAARGRALPEKAYIFAPKIISCDPAWTGGDEVCIGFRQGLYFKILEVMPKNDDDVLVANKLARWQDDEDADAVFIDLGYGTGIYSVGKSMGRQDTWQLIPFGGKATKLGFINKRAEMYGEIREFLQQGGSIPDDQILCEQLSWISTVPRIDGNIQLIDKEDMETSPGRADAFALTFALPVKKRQKGLRTTKKEFVDSSSYDPLAF